MQKLIIGCGYLGRRVARRWIDDGHRVAALTRSAAHAAAFRAEGIEPVLGDVTRPESLQALAAIPALTTVLYSVGHDRNSGDSRRDVLVGGLKNVLAALPQHGICFVHISSTSVYGQTGGEWVDETSVCQPSRENGRVCLEAEQTVREFFQTRAAALVCDRVYILRLAGIYGPGRLLRRIEQVRSGEPLEGNPEAYLNLIHVDDAVSAVRACELRQDTGDTYLISDDQPVRRREYYGALAELLGAPQPTFAANIDATQLNKRCSNARLRRELRIKLLYPTIREGLPHGILGDSSSHL
jgi:nucleoside-diphosphate-sugar epimerase